MGGMSASGAAAAWNCTEPQLHCMLKCSVTKTRLARMERRGRKIGESRQRLNDATREGAREQNAEAGSDVVM
jgi:hypothetical protein